MERIPTPCLETTLINHVTPDVCQLMPLHLKKQTVLTHVNKLAGRVCTPAAELVLEPYDE